MCAREQTPVALNALRALVAEDDFHIAFVIETALEAEGVEVIANVPRLDEAMEIAGNEQPDVAVVDIRLGEADSYPLIRLLRRMGTKVVLATGTEPSPELRGEFAEVPILKKPYTADDLLGLVRKIL